MRRQPHERHRAATDDAATDDAVTDHNLARRRPSARTPSGASPMDNTVGNPPLTPSSPEKPRKGLDRGTVWAGSMP